MGNNKNKQLRRKVRASYFISTVSIALVLFLLGTVGYLILNAFAATDRMKQNVTVNVMLRDGLSPAQCDSLAKVLQAHPSVRTVEFVGREKAAAEFKDYIGTDFEQFLGTNPLPDIFRVGVTSDSLEGGSVVAFEKELKTWPEVDEVVYQRSVVEQISSNIKRFLLILLLFGGTLLVISVILLRNTIRAVIYSKRHLINTMKLVGATRGFILRPFVAESALQGVYAGAIASALLVVMVLGLQEGLSDITLMLSNMELALIVAFMFVGGVLISMLCTVLAVNKFINMKTNQIYLY